MHNIIIYSQNIITSLQKRISKRIMPAIDKQQNMSSLSRENQGNRSLDASKQIHADNEASALAKTLDRLRQDDPFYFFSIPGALVYDSVPSKKSAASLASGLKSNVTRKTRVSCEVHSDLYFVEMFLAESTTNIADKLDVAFNEDMDEIPRKHSKTSTRSARVQKHKKVAAQSA